MIKTNQTLLGVGTDTQEGLFIESLLQTEQDEQTLVSYQQVQKMMDDNYEREWGDLNSNTKPTEEAEDYWEYKSNIRKMVGA